MTWEDDETIVEMQMPRKSKMKVCERMSAIGPLEDRISYLMLNSKADSVLIASMMSSRPKISSRVSW